MQNSLVERKTYLERLAQARTKRIIKVITGVRRYGKSTLLLHYQQLLLSQGIRKEQILPIHLDWLESEPLLEYHALYDYIKKHLQKNCTTYIFLDEVQLVPDFQKTVLSIFEQDDMDIYLTGSNATLLSGRNPPCLSRSIETCAGSLRWRPGRNTSVWEASPTCHRFPPKRSGWITCPAYITPSS